MIKRKKLFWSTITVVFAAFLLLFAIFSKIVEKRLISKISSKFLKCQIEYDNLALGVKQASLKNVVIKSFDEKNKKFSYFFKSKKITAAYRIKLFPFSINFDLFFKKPLIEIEKYKNENFFSFDKASIEGSGFLKYKLGFDRAEINLIDKSSEKIWENSLILEKDENGYFELKNKISKTSKIAIEYLADSHKKISFDFFETDLFDIFQISNFFNRDFLKKISSVDGKINGVVTTFFEKRKKPLILLNLKAKNFVINSKFFNQKFQSDSINFELSNFFQNDYSQTSLVQTSLVQTVINTKEIAKLHKYQTNLSIVNGKISAFDEKSLWKIEEISADISSNIKNGSKIDIKALASSHDNKSKIISILGKGYFLSKFSNWFDLDCIFAKGEKLSLKYIEKKDKSKSIGIIADNINEDHFYILKNFISVGKFSKLSNISLNKAKLSTNLNLNIDVENNSSIAVNKLEINGLDAYSKEANCRILLDDFKMCGMTKLCKKSFITDIANANIDLKNCKIYKNFTVDNAFLGANLQRVNLNIFENQFKNSSFIGEYDSIKFIGSILGKLNDINLNTTISGSGKYFSNRVDEKLYASINFKDKKDYFLCFGNVKSINDDKVLDDLIFSTKLTREIDFKKPLIDWISSAWIKAQNIDLDKTSLVDTHKFSGKCSFDLNYDNKKIEIDLFGRGLKCNMPFFNLSLKDSDQKIKISYDLLKNKFLFNRYKDEIYVSFPGFFLDFTIYELDVFLHEKNVFVFDILKASSKDLYLDGVFTLDINKRIDFVANSIDGNISAFNDLAKKFIPQIKSDLSGNVFAEKNGFSLTIPLKKDEKKDVKWGVNACFIDTSFSLFNNIDIDRLNGSVCITSDLSHLSIDNFKANILVNKNSLYQLNLLYFDKIDDEKALYDLRIFDGNVDIFRLFGSVLCESKLSESKLCKGVEKSFNKLIDIKLDEKFSYFYQTPIVLKNCIYDLEKKDFKSFDLSLDKNSSFGKKSFNKTSFNDFYSKCKFLSSILNFSDIENFLNCMNVKNYEFDFFTKISKKHYVDTKKGYWDFDFSLKRCKFFDHNFKDIDISICLDDKSAKMKCNIENLDIFANVDKLKNFNLSLKNNFQKLFLVNGSFDEKSIIGKIEKFTVDSKSLHEIDNYKFLNTNNVFGKFLGKFDIEGSFDLSFKFLEKPFDFSIDLKIDPNEFIFDSLDISNNSRLNINYSYLNGLRVENAKISFFKEKGIECNIKKIFYEREKKEFLFKDANIKSSFSFVKNILNSKKAITTRYLLENIEKIFKFDDKIDVDCDLRFCRNCLTAFSKNINIFSNNKPSSLKDFSLKCDKEKLNIDFNVKHFNNFFKISNTFNTKNFEGSLSFCEQNQKLDPLRINWKWGENNSILVSDIKGEFCGIDASFYLDEKKSEKTAFCLTGSILLNMKKAGKLLDKPFEKLVERLNLGDEYKVIGSILLNKQDLSIKEFVGNLYAKQFDFLDYKIKTLSLDIELNNALNKSDLNITNFKISDSSGILNIDHIFVKDLYGAKLLEVPSIILREFRPSLFNRKDGKKTEIKPLLIKNMYLENISGKLDDLSSIKAAGYIDFINSFKRDKSVFDMPSDVLSRIVGLDLQILVPTTGTLYFDINDKRVNLLELKETFSENKRSKFFFYDTPKSYIDFAGNIFCNIKMKHFVLFKITEPFGIEIRGNVKKPKVKFHKKKKIY
jgi:hypothetical protein